MADSQKGNDLTQFADQLWGRVRNLPGWLQFVLWLLAWPLLGALFFWRAKRLGMAGKVVAVLVLLFGVIFYMGVAIDNSSTTSEQAASTDSAESPESPSPEPSPLAEDGQLEAMMRDEFKGETNTSKERLVELDVVEQIDGGWGVFVEFNADDNLTCGSRKRGIERRMIDAYERLYTSPILVQQASMTALFPLVDRFGQESDGAVYKTILKRPVASKINWDNKGLIDFEDLWTTTILHVEFRDC